MDSAIRILLGSDTHYELCPFKQDTLILPFSLPSLRACAVCVLVQVDVTLEQTAAAHICIVPPEGRWRDHEVVGTGVPCPRTVCRRRHRTEQKVEHEWQT